MKLTRLFRAFYASEKSGGIVLIACTVISLLLANSSVHEVYLVVLSWRLGSHTLTEWVNDGLMSWFFLLIGLELKREFYNGELSKLKKALLPIMAAAGGMVLPACLFYLINAGTPFSIGWGIPMATDIAFAVGILALLGKRIPSSLKIFLTALAVIDDLGSILVIAIFYNNNVQWLPLLGVLGLMGVLILMNKWGVKNLFLYVFGGILMWFFMLQSGVHPTLSGVLLAFVIPFGDGSEKSSSGRLQQLLHKPVAFLVIPLFALANTGISISSEETVAFVSTCSLGVMLGLLVGKPSGILLFAFCAVRGGLCKLPADITWKHILGAGILGGIGFTMSIFITLLAFQDTEVIQTTKLAILLSSTGAGILGYFWLLWVGTLKRS